MKIEVGKFYRGKVNNCLIQIIATKEEQTVNGPVVIAMYVDTKTNKIDSAPLARLERSAFEEVSPEEVLNECHKTK